MARSYEQTTQEEFLFALNTATSIKDFCKKIKCSYSHFRLYQKDLEKFFNCDLDDIDMTVLKNKNFQKGLKNKKINNFIVLDFDYEKSSITKRKYWICQCVCGKFFSTREENLKGNNKIKSCGCCNKIDPDKHRDKVKATKLKKAKEFFIKKSFGKLTVKELNEEVTNKKVGYYWLCECECGNLTTVNSHSLISGHTQSCGCINSKGEEKIEKILNENNILFKKQYSFFDLVGANNGILKFDFAIFNKNKELACLIEYQGIQHYQSATFFGGDEKLNICQEHDKRKKEYCKNKNIPLIEILYTDYSKIDFKFLKDKIGVFLK